MRSGHHAVMNWYLSGCLGPVYHRDNVTKPLVGDYPVLKKRSTLPSIPILDDINDAGTISYAFERTKISTVKKFVEQEENEETPYVRKILVLRDPWNQFASHLELIKRHGRKIIFRDPDDIADIWVRYVRYAIRHRCEIIHFNEWVNEPFYRKRLCRRLEIRPDPTTLDQVPRNGGGSSFGTLNQTELSDRWKEWRDDPVWKHMVTLPRVKVVSNLFWDDPTIISSAG